MKRTMYLRFFALLTVALFLISCQDEVAELTTSLTSTVRSSLSSDSPKPSSSVGSGTSSPHSSASSTTTVPDDPPIEPIEGEWTWNPYAFDLLGGEYQASAEKLADAILAYEPSVELGADAEAVADNFAFEFPPAALVDLSVQSGTVRITYLNDRETHAKKLADFELAVENALNGTVKSEDSETLRALLLYRYVVDHVKYFTVDYTDKETTAFSALTEGVTICYGFSDAFGYLLRQTGMEAHLYRGSRSDGAEHGWTYAKVDGQFYHFDPTWETSNQKNYGERGLYYFGMNDSRRFSGLLKRCLFGFGALEQEGESDAVGDWLLPRGLYPYRDWSFDRESGEIICESGSLKVD